MTTARSTLSSRGTPAAGSCTRDIVVLDDDACARRLIAQALRRAGHSVVEVADAESFFDYLGSAALWGGGAPELVISDVNLPGRSGVDLIETLRGVSWSTPVLFISGDRDFDQRKRAGALPASAFLAKPFSMAAIRQCVDELLGRA